LGIQEVFKKLYDETKEISQRQIVNKLTNDIIKKEIRDSGIYFPDISPFVIQKRLAEMRDTEKIKYLLLRNRSKIYDLEDLPKIISYISERQKEIDEIPRVSIPLKNSNIYLRNLTKDIQKQKKSVEKTIKKAKSGDNQAIKTLKKSLSLKVYTKKELKEYTEKNIKKPRT
jgi:hypothetical protein